MNSTQPEPTIARCRYIPCDEPVYGNTYHCYKHRDAIWRECAHNLHDSCPASYPDKPNDCACSCHKVTEKMSVTPPTSVKEKIQSYLTF